MSDKIMVKIEEADFASLKNHAEVILGLEVPRGSNGNGLRAKILAAAPGTTEIEQATQVAAPIKAPAPAAKAVPAPRYSLGNPAADPKVRLTIAKTADVTRAKEVTISVNGYVWRAQRGVEIDLPYRAYLALRDAKEMRPVLQDEEGDFGLPKYEYQEEQSYPYTIIEMPSADEIAAWEAATSGDQLDKAA